MIFFKDILALVVNIYHKKFRFPFLPICFQKRSETLLLFHPQKALLSSKKHFEWKWKAMQFLPIPLLAFSATSHTNLDQISGTTGR